MVSKRNHPQMALIQGVSGPSFHAAHLTGLVGLLIGSRYIRFAMSRPPMWLRPLEDMEMMGSTNPVLNRHLGGRTNFEVGDCAAISSTNLWPATRFGHTGNSCGSAISDFYSWDDMKPIGAITLKWRLNTPRPTPHGFLCYFDAVNPEDPEVTVTEWGDFCDSVDLHAGPVAGRCWKALGKIFALGVLGDHGYGESLTKRFDFCPRCYYLARCYAYVWVLCCWGHLSNGIRMRFFVDTDVGAHVLFFRSEIGCGNAFDCDSDLGPGANLFRMVRRALGGVLSPGGYVQLFMACARHRAPSLLFVLQMMLVYVF